MFHVVGSIMTSMPTLRAGGQVITIPKFKPDLYATTLEKFKPTFLHLVPPLLTFLATDERITSKHLDSVENVTVNFQCICSNQGCN